MLCLLFAFPNPTPKIYLSDLSSPILFWGGKRAAYREPAIFYHNDSLFMFCTLVRLEDDNRVYSYTAMRQTKDLRNWSPVWILTPHNQGLDYGL